MRTENKKDGIENQSITAEELLEEKINILRLESEHNKKFDNSYYHDKLNRSISSISQALSDPEGYRQRKLFRRIQRHNRWLWEQVNKRKERKTQKILVQEN